ncbi:hypothetical protein [Streptomyces sp. NPDC050988]|uniref:hypothetical protein n=1 Tax=Streptomyces sp. NPDC050988 TaxID=3365637 RepID=UPI0037960913
MGESQNHPAVLGGGVETLVVEQMPEPHSPLLADVVTLGSRTADKSDGGHQLPHWLRSRSA